MRIVYGLGVLLEAILIAHCAICSFKKHDRLGKSVCIYETLTFACAIVFFVFTFVPGHTVTVLAKGLTMLCLTGCSSLLCFIHSIIQVL